MNFSSSKCILFILYSLLLPKAPSFALDVDGIGKKLTVNGEIAATAELHPRSMIRSLYDNNGIQMLKVEEYGVSKRTILWPKSPYHPVDRIYDDTGKVHNWSWGEIKHYERTCIPR